MTPVERRSLWYATLFSILAILWLCGACAFPERTVHGTLLSVKHDDRYESPCGVIQHIRHQCDDMPACCSYQAIVQDSTGHRWEVWAFWPRYVPGLLGLVPVGGVATFHLHVRPLRDLQSCGLYGCPTKLEYALDADVDVRP